MRVSPSVRERLLRRTTAESVPSPLITALALLVLTTFDRPGHGDGSGAFVDSGQQLGSFEVSASVAIGDIDGDGHNDAFVDAYLSPLRLWLNAGDGTLVDSGRAFPTTTGDGGLLLRDVDDDGDLDVFGVQAGVWLNDGFAGFALHQTFGIVRGHQRSGAGDLDDDGDVDFFVCRLEEESNVPLFNDGTGMFDVGSSASPLTSLSAATGDLDGDGDLDVFLAREGANRVLLNEDGRGHFVDSGQALGDRLSWDVLLGDLDGDGDLDAYVVNGSKHGFPDASDRIWLNDGRGHFDDSGQALGAGVGRDGSLADVDGDGDLDALVAPLAGVYLEVWGNDGAAGFESIEQDRIDSPIINFGMGAGDLDGDGDVDAFLARAAGGDRVLINLDAPECPADFDGSGAVDFADLLAVLTAWNNAGGTEDLDDSGTVDFSDLLILLAAWGPCE